MAGTQWREVDPSTSTSFPRAPGVYVLYLAGQIIYIGSSSNLRVRMRSYGLTQNGFSDIKRAEDRLLRADRCKIKVVHRYGAWLELEARLIFRLRPIECVQGVGCDSMSHRGLSNNRATFHHYAPEWKGNYRALGLHWERPRTPKERRERRAELLAMHRAALAATRGKNPLHTLLPRKRGGSRSMRVEPVESRALSLRPDDWNAFDEEARRLTERGTPTKAVDVLRARLGLDLPPLRYPVALQAPRGAE